MSQPRSAARRSIGVLFVCLGNICRSPMAEGIFRNLVEQAGFSDQIAVDSAGTGAWHIGEPPHAGTRRVLQRRGITLRHTARVVSQSDFPRFDYIIALDRANLRDLRVMGAGVVGKLALLMEFAPAAGVSDVPDPYFDGRFEEASALIEQGCRGLLDHIFVTHRLTARVR